VLDLELKRPTPPRPPKRAKSWEEEDDEQEAAQKAGKAGTKTKRRSQPLLDEDEDIEIELLDDEDDLSGEPAPVQVSLSLARPPKPKGKPTQAKPAAAPTQKNRKPSGGSDRSFRRDRREQEVKERPTQITLRGSLSVHDLAEILSIPETDIIKTLFLKGIAANVNQILDIPTATMVAQEIGIEVETAEAEAEAKKVTEMLDATDLENLQRRPPVVTIMGHVDHGKTTLLDSIRKTKVAQGEAGGITQHIGAYHVDVEHDGRTEQVVFLDTPGHEAFTAMRARGARVTDVAVLVVAADDGVRPQTIEAISHAKAAEVPIVVAINKVDKEEAQPDRVKQELTEYGLVAEEWGGDTIMVPVSALTGENLDNLLEMLLLVSEVEDLYANPDRLARGTVIEANLDKARGPVATLLIQNGTLRVGDILVAGSAFGKVRAMVDDRGKRVKEASPSFAVEVLGLNDVPAAGDDFEVYSDEKEARNTALGRVDQQRQSRLQQAMASRRVSLNTLSAQAQEGELKELNLVLKADVQGSLEAILAALQQLPQKEVQVRVLLSAPGEITETDVDLAAASNAVIVGFNTTFASGARQAADQAGVDVRDYNIIYKLLEDIQGAMEGLLEPELVEEPLGQVEVRAVFPVGRGNVAGCYVLSGKAIRNCKIRVRRGGEVVYEGNLDSLKRMKDDAKEVNAGFECGIRLDGFNNWSEGDIIETYRLVTKRRTLSA
jgi:translation initiation factor IF-2